MRDGKIDLEGRWNILLLVLLIVFCLTLVGSVSMAMSARDARLHAEALEAQDTRQTVDIEDASCVVWETFEDRVLLDCRRKR